MTTQYTPILKLALPVTGELSGSWGDVVNDNITAMVEQAIAGLATINTWTTNSHTLTIANGTTAEARCAILVAENGAGLSAAGEIICPAASKIYVLDNNTSYTITLKTSGGTGVAVPAGGASLLVCDGTNVVAGVKDITGNAATAAVSAASTITTSATASAFKVPFANTTANTTGNYDLLQDDADTFTYNPSTNTLVVGTVSGALSGNATTATTLQTARTINGVSFNGSANITVTAANPQALTIGTGLSGTSYDGSSAVTVAIDSSVVTLTGTQTLTNKTVTNLVFDGRYTEEVFTITDGASVDLNPANGTIQLWTLGASRTPTATSFGAGQSMTLMINDGAAYTITWPSVTWVNNTGTAPTLNATGFTVVALWKVSTTLYGALVGNGE